MRLEKLVGLGLCLKWVRGYGLVKEAHARIL